MADFVAYMKFQGNCREAMAFYQSCLGGQMHIMTIGESPMKDKMPASLHDNIMHAVLTSGNVMLMGSDLIGEEVYTHGTALAICLVCKSKEEIATLFAKLSEGGQVTMPLSEMFFGTYGDLVDKYGFKWMFQYGATAKM
ncbi:MAG: VOC family protein [Acidaminococcaceae bacterium]